MRRRNEGRGRDRKGGWREGKSIHPLSLVCCLSTCHLKKLLGSSYKQPWFVRCPGLFLDSVKCLYYQCSFLHFESVGRRYQEYLFLIFNRIILNLGLHGLPPPVEWAGLKPSVAPSGLFGFFPPQTCVSIAPW